jgi:radical SAM superfamily enzyme YgiQ (UPF0313 family)
MRIAVLTRGVSFEYSGPTGENGTFDMKLLLIQPAQLDANRRPMKFKKLIMPFLNLATLAALTPNGIDVSITDDYVEEIDFETDADLVGITGMSCQAGRAYQIADEFRKRGIPTIMGGIHVSARPEEALEHADSVLIGEAEDLWDRVLADAESGRLRSIYQAERAPDLGRLVIPRYDLFDFGNYLIPPGAKTPTIPIQTSRGCPNRCDFCSVVDFLGHEMRTKPVENVIREIESLRPSKIFFADDNINGDPQHARELFAALKPLKLRWSCQMTTQIMKDPDLIELAAEAGCHENFVGIEAVTEENLRSIHKEFNKPEEYKRFFKRLSDAGIFAQVAIMFGFDEDTVESLKRTMDTILSWNINYLYIGVLTPLPGTKLFQRLDREGRITTTDWSFYDCVQPVIDFTNITYRELVDAIWEGYERFYSIANILRRMWRFRRPYVKHYPRVSPMTEMIYSLFMRKSIKAKQHPSALGLRKDPAEPASSQPTK